MLCVGLLMDFFVSSYLIFHVFCDCCGFFASAMCFCFLVLFLIVFVVSSVLFLFVFLVWLKYLVEKVRNDCLGF